MAAIEEMQEERGISKADAARRVLRAGLENIDDDNSGSSGNSGVLESAVDGAEQSLRFAAAFALTAAGFTYLPLVPTEVGAVLLVPALLGLLVTFTRLQTAFAVLRSEGYGWVEMARIGLSAHTPDRSTSKGADA
jgi:hypothetical protein